MIRLIMIASLLLTGCGKSSHPQETAAPSPAPAPKTYPACRDALSTRICDVDAVPTSVGDCSGGTPAPAAETQALLAALDQSLPLLQNTACGLEQIYVVKTMGTHGLTFPGVVLLSERLFSAAYQVPGDFLGLAEQRFFKDGPKTLPLAAGLPQSSVPGVTLPADFALAYVLTHELGHALDDASVGLSDPFKALSWKSDPSAQYGVAPKKALAHPAARCLQDGNCSGGQLAVADASAIYAELAGSGFVTLYAETLPAEDFAESLAMSWIDAKFGALPVVTVDGRPVLDYKELIHGSAYEAKRALVTKISATQ